MIPIKQLKLLKKFTSNLKNSPLRNIVVKNNVIYATDSYASYTTNTTLPSGIYDKETGRLLTTNTRQFRRPIDSIDRLLKQEKRNTEITPTTPHLITDIRAIKQYQQARKAKNTEIIITKTHIKTPDETVSIKFKSPTSIEEPHRVNAKTLHKALTTIKNAVISTDSYQYGYSPLVVKNDKETILIMTL